MAGGGAQHGSVAGVGGAQDGVGRGGGRGAEEQAGQDGGEEQDGQEKGAAGGPRPARALGALGAL
ncbi:hypothetical protein GCM10018980_67560 [Streptomyces capoamus]|uniref:Uncharacterized protein n=1 Tax=Streptomyces capoamus TaxID=68183 RepID=A0A919F341_9ACTN|nr:hypothetical protein GCM10010501_72900 [Streptomyces libani subsp. rufus]GHG71873.1 hypothetical protein GCM10018980_67560 [Streptomyces capoamus]